VKFVKSGRSQIGSKILAGETGGTVGGGDENNAMTLGCRSGHGS
jgi:hypothetical protein